jgi:hypothetical protein
MRVSWLIRFSLYLLAILLVTASGFTVWKVFTFATDSQSFHQAMDRQLASIKRLEECQPSDWSQNEWDNAIPYNVWGNAVYDFYRPPSSDLRAMAQLQERLDLILRETTKENSLEAIDQIYSLLISQVTSQHAKGFVRRHQEVFQTAVNYRTSRTPVNP